MKYLILTSLILLMSCSSTIPIVFEEPRHEGFKIKPIPHDAPDNTSIQHFVGSIVLSMGLSYLFKECGVKHYKTAGFLTAFGIGFLKEYEDGYREGFSRMDLLFDVYGSGLGAFLYKILDK